VLRVTQRIPHLGLAVQHPAFSSKAPDCHDRDHVPDDGFLKRAPRHLRRLKYVGPEFSRWGGELKWRKFRRRKKIGKVIEENDVTRFELEQELETRICLDRNSSRLRN
jgi:hypothetical protein